MIDKKKSDVTEVTNALFILSEYGEDNLILTIVAKTSPRHFSVWISYDELHQLAEEFRKFKNEQSKTS